jgi:drug/metabolite transporter (DMT)-like permease
MPPEPHPSPRRLSGNLRGVLLMLLAAFCSSAMNGVIRHLSDGIHPFEIAFFRNLFGVAVLLPMLARQGLARLRTRKLPLHALRGALNVVAMLTFFLAISMTPLADVAALSFTSPLFASLGAVVILREVMGPRRWTGLAIGFLGALVILRPGVDTVSLGALLVIGSSAAWAMALLIIKVLGRTESSLTTTLYAGLFLMPASLLAAAFFWTWPTIAELLWLVLVGILGSGAQLSVAQAFREGESTAILPMDFTKLIWGSLIGYAFFAEIPAIWTWAGGSLIFASVVYIAYRESRVAPASTRPADAAG